MPTKRERLDALGVELRQLADRVDNDEATSEDVATLSTKTTEYSALLEEVKAAALAGKTVDMASAFLEDGKAQDFDRDAAPEVNDGIVNPKGMTLGEAFTKSPAYAEFVGQFRKPDGSLKDVRDLRSGQFDVRSFQEFVGKDLVTGASDTSGGAFVQPYRYGPVTDLVGQRTLTVRDLCTNLQITSDTFDYVRVTGKTNNAAGVAEATSSADPAYTTDGATVTVTPAAGGGYKPESAMTLAVVSTPVETIAHLMPLTRRAAADAPQVRALIDQFLLYGLDEEVEDQILNGDGTSPNLEGILQTTGINTVGSAGTDIDAIVDAIRTIRADRRNPTAMVIHPNDWYSTGFLLAKDSQNRYLLGDPRASVDQLNTLWGLRVVVTEAMTENTALVGDFRQCVVADRMQNTIYVTDSHKDWFARNLLAVLAETRLAVGVLDPEAFATVTSI